jgi:FAD/FMN-containing dehydrogenase
MSLSSPSPASAAAAASLRGLCAGSVHLPGDPGYDDARLAWNVAVPQLPAAVAFPASAGDVREVVRAAAAAGLRVAPQGTGHNARPLPALDDAVLLRTSAMRGVQVDAERRVARVEAGALWADVVGPAAREGLAALHGSARDVSVVGHALGGGVGWYSRKLGLAADSVTAVELVLADGSSARADRSTNPDLFWALRGGGGGSFGVVTALELDLHPIETVYGGMLAWDQRDAEAVLRRWVEWTATAPEEVTTSFRLLNVPPMPEIPEPFRGRRLAVIDGGVLDTDERAEQLLAPLRALQPEIDTFGRIPAAEMLGIHMDPEGPTPSVSGSALLRDLPATAVDSLLQAAGPGSGSSLLMAELRHLGGALARSRPDAGALSRLDGEFLLFGVAIAATPELAAQGQADAARLVAAMTPYAQRGAYLNFAERPVDVSASFSDGSWRRLVDVRSQVDPDGLFLANHPVPRKLDQKLPNQA